MRGRDSEANPKSWRRNFFMMEIKICPQIQATAKAKIV
jgi:hypothetical protein